MRDAINNWNCGTNRWLRTIVYERVPKKYGTLLTFTLSAVWHGFYPGYYLTFATGAIMVTSARVARRMFRHRFQQTQNTRMFYDILTCLTTRLVMGYATFPFVLLELMGSIRLYLKFYLCLHIIALIIIYVLPKFIRGERLRSTFTTSNIATAENVRDSDNDKLNSTHASATTNTLNNSQQKLNANEQLAAVGVANGAINQNNADDTATDLNNSTDTPPAAGAAATITDHPRNTNLQNSSTTSASNTKTNTQSLEPLTVAYARNAVSFKHDQCEMEQLSNKLKEKIEAETKNIEEFIDKTVTDTVTGIVEFKKDLMRDSDKIFISQDGLRKRSTIAAVVDGVVSGGGGIGSGAEIVVGKTTGDDANAFLKKEIEVINAVVQQANVLPAVLSNGHAK